MSSHLRMHYSPIINPLLLPLVQLTDLPDPVRAVLRLRVAVRVPVRVVDDYLLFVCGVWRVSDARGGS